MSSETQPVDKLAEATGGKLHWNDPGMDDFEKGWEPFTLGKRVEIRTPDDTWKKGTIVETLDINDRAIVVETDERVHDNDTFYSGRGLTLPVMHNTRRGILSNIRAIDEEAMHVEVPMPKPKELVDKGAELLGIVELAVQNSGGRLRLAFGEEDEGDERKKHIASAGRFLKFDGKRVGRDVEMYDFMGRSVLGWEQVLAMFLGEVLSPVKGQLPESYSAAASKLKELGEKVYEGDTLNTWRDLFQEDTQPQN